MASVVKKTQATKPSKKTSVKEKVSSKSRAPKEKAIKKKAREAAEADFNFSDAFDQAERDSKLTAVEVSERVELNTVIHSGSLVMDLVVYGGGLQAGRIYDLHGPESGGKTTLGNIILVQAIKSIPGPVGKTKGYYIDAEGTLDRVWFRNIAKSYGVDLSLKEIFGKKDENGAWLYKPTIRLLKPTVGDVLLKTLVRVLNAMPDKVFMQDHWMYSWTPVEAKVAKKTGGLTDKQLRAMLESKGIAWDKDLFNKSGSFMAPIPNNYGGPELVVLIDSMIALTPRQTAEDDSAAMAQHGRMFSKWINAIKSLAAAKGVTFININQLRKNPGQMFGDPTYSPGGEAIKYVADCRNIVSPCANPSGGGQIEEEGKDVYRWTSFTNKKNKLSAPGTLFLFQEQTAYFFRWTSFTNKKNKLSAPGTKIKFRWWTQRDGKTGCGLDPVHDTLEYLELTGQLVEKGRKGFYVILAGHEKAKSVLDTYMFNTQSFKEFVVSGIFSNGDYKARCDIRKICREQIKSGLAFTLYKGSSKAKKSEVIDEDDED